MFSIIRRYLLSGLLVWLPIWVTFLMIRFLINLMDGMFKLLPDAYQPDQLIGVHIPGLGLILTLIVLFFTGMIAANFLGRAFGRLWNAIVLRIPLVRSIYMSVRKVLETIFTSQSKAFRKVYLVEYPRKELWSIAFQTGRGCAEIQDKTEKETITIFIPTTPNPTSGFLIMVPKEDAYELDMSIEEALKLVISLGVVSPEKMASRLKEGE